MPSFTKQAIKAAFMKLLDERPLNQITVKDIVTECGISRNSFYYHYSDIPAMITEIIIERADDITAQYGSVDTLEECLRAAVQFAQENKRAILHIYRSISRDQVEEYLMRICRYTVERYIETAIGQVPVLDEDREIIIRFVQCECFGQAVAWLNSGMRYDIEAQFSRLCVLIHGMIDELVRRCGRAAAGDGAGK